MSTAVTFVAGVLVGGFLGAAGRSAWEALQRRVSIRLSASRQRRARAAEKARLAREARAKDEEERLERADLEAARVGSTFRRRYTADDPGTLLTVLSLDERNWRSRVIVEEIVPPGRPSTAHDNIPTRTSMSWRALTEPDADQRHRTACLYERAFDDSAGWVEFERTT